MTFSSKATVCVIRKFCCCYEVATYVFKNLARGKYASHDMLTHAKKICKHPFQACVFIRYKRARKRVQTDAKKISETKRIDENPRIKK